MGWKQAANQGRHLQRRKASGSPGSEAVHLQVSPPAVWKCVDASGVGMWLPQELSVRPAFPSPGPSPPEAF